MGSTICLERDNNDNCTQEPLFGSKYNSNKDLQIIFKVDDFYKIKSRRRKRRKKKKFDN